MVPSMWMGNNYNKIGTMYYEELQIGSGLGKGLTHGPELRVSRVRLRVGKIGRIGLPPPYNMEGLTLVPKWLVFLVSLSLSVYPSIRLSVYASIRGTSNRVSPLQIMGNPRQFEPSPKSKLNPNPKWLVFLVSLRCLATVWISRLSFNRRIV